MNTRGFSHDLSIKTIRLPRDVPMEVKMENEEKMMLFRFGMKEGIRLFAVWKDGKQLVGVMRQELSVVLKRVDDGGLDYLYGSGLEKFISHGIDHRKKLSDADVRKIRSSSDSCITLGKRYGVAREYIYRIKNGTRRENVHQMEVKR